MISLSLLPVASLLGNLGIGIIIVAAFAVGAVAIQLLFRANDSRRSAASADQSATALQALGEKIETLVGEQQLQGETHRQVLAQKIDAIGQRFDEQRSAVDGLRNEVRHESRRRDAELEEIRHQIAAIQQQTALALPPAPSPVAELPPHPVEAAPEPTHASEPIHASEPVRDPDAAPEPEFARVSEPTPLPEPTVAPPATAEVAPPAPQHTADFARTAGDGAMAPSDLPASASDDPTPDGPMAAGADTPTFDPFALEPLSMDAFDDAPAEPEALDTPSTDPVDDWDLVDGWPGTPTETTVADTTTEEPADEPANAHDELADPPFATWSVEPAPVEATAETDPFALASTPQAPGSTDETTSADPFAESAGPSPFDPWEVITDLDEMAGFVEADLSALEADEPEPLAPSFDTVDLLDFETPSFAPAAPTPPGSARVPFAPRPAGRTEPAPAAPTPHDTEAPAESAWVARAPRVEALPEPAAQAAATPAPVEIPEGEIPEGADVLTVITSVDDDLQRALYAVGVTSLDEIARWGRGDARRFATDLGVSEDLIMGQWVFEAQAALFSQYARQAG